MLYSKQFGDVRITRIPEYSGPTHIPTFLFPDLSADVLKSHAEALAPHQWTPESNRLVVSMATWLVQTPTANILIDTGVGNGKDRPGIARMHRLNTLYLEWLAAAGATREAITHVVITHLHMDHVGWNTVFEGDAWRPTFPNARYMIPRVEYNDTVAAIDGGAVNRAFDDSVRPVVDAGLLDLFEPGDLIGDRLRVEAAYGHTSGQVTLALEGGASVRFVSDVFHSPLQILEPDLNTRYCEIPEAARATRRAVLERAVERDEILLPMHFGFPYGVKIRRESEGRYAFAPLTWD